jgi:hypothetical protein
MMLSISQVDIIAFKPAILSILKVWQAFCLVRPE